MPRRPLSSPVALALVAGAAAAVLGASPAGATEGPVAPPPPALFPGLQPPPAPTFPSPLRDATVIRRARVAPRRVRRGQRARLIVALNSPSRLLVTVSRRARGRRIRVAMRDVPVRGRRVVVRLPRRVDGHGLHAARYRVRVVAIDAAGNRSRPVDVTLVVQR